MLHSNMLHTTIIQTIRLFVKPEPVIKGFALAHRIEYKINTEFNNYAYDITYDLTKQEQ